jgi:hypothetical protein
LRYNKYIPTQQEIQMHTLQDAVKEREAADMVMFARQDKAEAARKEVADILQAYKGIGVLIRKGKSVYYLNNPYKESSNIKDLV